MFDQIIYRFKSICIVSIFGISWEITDFFLYSYYGNPYYLMLKYSIIFMLITLFIVTVNKYAIILFLELVPFLNLLPLFTGFSIYSILYVLYKKHKLHRRPSVTYSQIKHLTTRNIYCPNCGFKIVGKVKNCPNCGREIELSLDGKCPICKSNKHEEIIECPFCKTRFHKRCFLEWIKIKGT
ncbi:MAG: hypothetical protein ACTSUG_01735, partial [Candidatus Helarchaeota archaeon]